ncbi:MAG TPA: DUF6770 family protein [Puia sp.]|nr:DUF6770 family protein [Puia sp.]
MKKILLPLICLCLAVFTQAQSKIFKEVGEDISTQVRSITQDNALVGYLAFTRLEKADADSFNYRLTIMDENLNDIGTVNFRERSLDLQAVSFEQDVLCLGYIESALAGTVSYREARKAMKNGATSQVMLQFISLTGKIINKFSTDVELSSYYAPTGHYFSTSVNATSYLKYGMQIKNIAGKGFCVFYGDDSKKELLVLGADGKLARRRKIGFDAAGYLILTSGPSMYLLAKNNDDAPEGGFRIFTYPVADSSTEYKFDLKDKQGNQLKVLAFDNDPVTGKAFLAGCVINPDRTKDFVSAHDYARNPYLGVFTLELGKTQRDSKPVYSYWNNGNMPGISQDGLFADKSFYVKYATAFRDYNGNTVFAGTALVEKRLLGAAKYRLADGVFVFQDNAGKLRLDNNITCDETNYFGPGQILSMMDKKDFYKVVNSDTKTNYMIIDDAENTYVYNVNKQKVMRTIQHKDGSIKTSVYPAKEGHIMVSEYNRKGKYTRFSIEALTD